MHFEHDRERDTISSEFLARLEALNPVERLPAFIFMNTDIESEDSEAANRRAAAVPMIREDLTKVGCPVDGEDDSVIPRIMVRVNIREAKQISKLTWVKAIVEDVAGTLLTPVPPLSEVSLKAIRRSRGSED